MIKECFRKFHKYTVNISHANFFRYFKDFRWETKNNEKISARFQLVRVWPVKTELRARADSNPL